MFPGPHDLLSKWEELPGKGKTLELSEEEKAERSRRQGKSGRVKKRSNVSQPNSPKNR